MKEKKINLLFDASIFANNFATLDANRSGIFFTAYNVLKELLKHPEFNVEFYLGNCDLIPLQNFFKEGLPSGNYKIADIYCELNMALPKLEHLLEKNRRTKERQSQTVFMTIKRTILKVTFQVLKSILGKKLLKRFDIYFSPVHKAPDFIAKNKKIQKYTIIYDTIPLMPSFIDDKAFYKEHWFYKLIESINKDDYYFSDSENSKQDFIKYVPNIDGNKITTTLLAASENFYRCEDKEKNIRIKQKYNIPLDKKYVFSLCTLEPRKNLIFAIKNFFEFIKKNKIDDLVFVLGGANWYGVLEQLDKLKDAKDYKDKIIRAGYIDDEDLASLYSNAQMVAYPTLYEGFGLPPLEAMQCGCPVITSNVASVPEVMGDVGIMINPKKDEELIEAFENLYYNEDLCKELSQKGMERAKKFSWEKTVNIMVEKMLENYNKTSHKK